MRSLFVLFVLLSCLALPSTAFAQASITGVVRDTSGAVLPGVTVEATSPALIEKVRTVVTDATGQYRIVDLRPGTYAVTFTLPGFSTVRREGLDVAGDATFQVNSEMRVGALEETITVTGETPVVDVQSTRIQTTLDTELVTALPTARNYQNLHVLIPSVTVAVGTQDVGGAGGDAQIYFAAHGSNPLDSRTQVNGLFVGDPAQGGGRTLYVPSVGTAQETNITTSGGLGEAETAGIIVNIITKDGGNIFSGTLFGTGATPAMIADNYDEKLRVAGLRAPNKPKNNFDIEAAYGGPVFENKLWFFAQGRYHGNNNYIAGMFPNTNAGDAAKWTYEPDFSEQSFQHSHWTAASMRLTWQATARNKFVAFYEDQLRCASCPGGGSKTGSGGPTAAPEAGTGLIAHPNNVGQATWSSPVNNRVLLEAGWGIRQLRFGSEPIPELRQRTDLIRVTAQRGSIPGLAYRACSCGGKTSFYTYSTRASMTYATGAHSVKFGYNGVLFVQQRRTNILSGDGLQYRFTTPDADGVPNLLTMNATPFEFQTRTYTAGWYAQDQWTINRLTLGGGVRYDLFTTYFPAAQLGPVRFVPTPVVFPASRYVLVHDVTPRISAAYDVFGNGKTAVKVSLGKYVVAQDGGSAVGAPLGANAAPMARIATSTSRAWNDANRNFVADCDLLNRLANGECGAIANENFGTATFDTTHDPDILRGWGVRPYNWNFDVTLQHELMPRLGATVGFSRRWFGNFLITQNRALQASDYTFFDLPISDPRLPVSGVVRGFFDVNSAPGACGRATGCFGLVDNYVTASRNFGKQTQHWNGVDATISARLQDLQLNAGVSTGRESRDICEVAQKAPSVLLTANVVNAPTGVSLQPQPIPMGFCSVDGSFVTQIKAFGAYTVPRIGVQLSGTWQNLPGEELRASYAAPNAVVAPLLGRNLAGNQATTQLNVLPPLTYYSDRVNQLDFRAAKLLRFGQKRAQVTLDLYNALNSNVVLTYNSSYTPNGAWRLPTGILPARVAKVSAQLDF